MDLVLNKTKNASNVWNQVSRHGRHKYRGVTKSGETRRRSWRTKVSYVYNSHSVKCNQCQALHNHCKRVKPGPVTNSAYFNFLRTVRPRYCGLLPQQIAVLAAYEWRCLTEPKKQKYRIQVTDNWLLHINFLGNHSRSSIRHPLYVHMRGRCDKVDDILDWSGSGSRWAYSYQNFIILLKFVSKPIYLSNIISQGLVIAVKGMGPTN